MSVSSLGLALLAGCANVVEPQTYAAASGKEIVTGSNIPRSEPFALGTKTISKTELAHLQNSRSASNGGPAGQ